MQAASNLITPWLCRLGPTPHTSVHIFCILSTPYLIKNISMPLALHRQQSNLITPLNMKTQPDSLFLNAHFLHTEHSIPH